MWNRTETEIGRKIEVECVFLRHGATRSNIRKCYLGRTDEPLGEAGKEELRQRKAQNYYPQVNYLFASPMTRCLETAAILYPNRNPVVIEEWQEMDFGAFEGKNYQDLAGDERYQAWIDSNGELPFPDGESKAEFIQRCDKGLGRMLEMLKKQLEADTAQEACGQENCGKEVVSVGILAHGGTLMSLLSLYHGGDYYDYQVKPGCGYRGRLVWQEGSLRINDLTALTER